MQSGTESSQSPKDSSPSKHLSYPSPTPDSTPDDVTDPLPTSRQVLKDRLYIGNLHPSVDEYALLQIFSKFGKVTKLDFLFHKTGALKGKPRGYAFVEYGTSSDALKALSLAHDKLLRGRKLIVTYAQQAPLDQMNSAMYQSGTKHRKGMMETGRPTTLSLLKMGSGSRREGTQDKIAMMEAKLRQMERSKPQVDHLGGSSTFPLGTSLHPSLPPKPPTTTAASNAPQLASISSTSSDVPAKMRAPLPNLPLSAPSTNQPLLQLAKGSAANSASIPSLRAIGKSKLVGVKISKQKHSKLKEGE